MHERQRLGRLEQDRAFLARKFRDFVAHFASGSDIDPSKIRLRLETVYAGTRQSELFKFATSLWSVPVSKGFGRRLRYLVWDDSNGKLVGLIALGDPVFNLGVRDKLIGWTASDRAARLGNVLDAFVLGAVPPYNMLLGGKAVAALAISRDIYTDFLTKYGSSSGLISGVCKHSRLLAVTTSSALGRSSLYNRINLLGRRLYTSIGFTEGWGHFHVPDDIFQEMRCLLRDRGHPYADHHRYGQGPNWRLRTIREALKVLNFDESLLRHGVRREVFLAPLAVNAVEMLRTGQGVEDLSKLSTASEISDAAVDRWIVPRSVRRPHYMNWRSEELLRHVHTTLELPCELANHGHV